MVYHKIEVDCDEALYNEISEKQESALIALS